MRQLYRAHTMLFVCAYAGFLGYFAATDPNDPVATFFSARSDVNERSQPLAAVAPPPGVSRNGANVADEADEKAPVVNAASPPAIPDDSAQQQERVRLSQMSLQATRAEEPQKRAEAIDLLDAATPETLQALQAVVTSDSAVRNRIRAVNSLRLLAEREGAQDAVISILHLAMTDANASVASRANEVYRELTQEPAPAE